MADDRTELLRDTYAALNSGDIEAALALLDPRFELCGTSEALDIPPVLRGHDEIRQWFRGVAEAFVDWSWEPLEFTPVGDQVFAPARLHATGKGSGVRVEVSAFHVWAFSGGRPSRLVIHVDRARALQATGLA